MIPSNPYPPICFIFPHHTNHHLILKDFSFNVCVFLYVCVRTVYVPIAHRGQKRVLDLLKLELEQTVVNSYMGAGNRTWLLYRSSKCSSLLRHFCRPHLICFRYLLITYILLENLSLMETGTLYYTIIKTQYLTNRKKWKNSSTCMCMHTQFVWWCMQVCMCVFPCVLVVPLWVYLFPCVYLWRPK